MKLENFVSKFDDFSKWKPTQQIDYITYCLTADDRQGKVTASVINEAFRDLDLRAYKRAAAYLSENASRENGKYVKVSNGYRLRLSRFNEIDKLLKNEPQKVAVSSHLVDQVAKVSEKSEEIFLREALNCFRVEAYRAFVIMVWLVAMQRLQKHILSTSLSAFNDALEKSPDKKVKRVVTYDHFGDLQESKVIELARSSGVISNDVRKLLVEKLGIRNSAAHPSGVTISGHKATEFGLDLIENVILKY